MSRIRQFKRMPTLKIQELKVKQLKKRTFSKMQWGVHAYNEWRVQRLSDVVNFDVKIFEDTRSTS